MTIVCNAEFICEFLSFQHWVNHASTWLNGYQKGTVICLDINNNLCHIGADFMKARKEELFPVKCYKLIRTIEN